jgi:hypothetical protein
LDLEALGCAFAELALSQSRTNIGDSIMQHYRCYFLNTQNWIIGAMTRHGPAC